MRLKIGRLVFGVWIVCSTLTMSKAIAEEQVQHAIQIAIYDEQFQPVSSHSLVLNESPQVIPVTVFDSQKIYFSLERCDSKLNCKTLKLDLKNEISQANLERADSSIARHKSLELSLQTFDLTPQIAVEIKIKDEKIKLTLTNAEDVKTNKRSSLLVNFNFSERYKAHLKADQFIRNFTLADYASQGGFHGLPGITTKRILEEFGPQGAQEVLGLVVESEYGKNTIVGAKDLEWSPNHDGKVIMFSCGLCHYSRAAGLLIPGLGNKNVSPAALGQASLDAFQTSKYRKAKWLRKIFLNKEQEKIEQAGEDSALRVTRGLVSAEYHNLTQGLTSVNQTPLRFYRDLGIEPPMNYPRAPSKAQAMWGLGVKRAQGGQFSEAGADGGSPGWAAGFDMGSEMSTEHMLENQEKLEAIQAAFGDLLSPKYPFEIDRNLAQKGAAHFEQKCAQCHAANGPYERDDSGHSIFYPPKLIPLELVSTEPERAHLFDGLEELLSQHPLQAILKLTPFSQRPYLGYYSPRLTGIWSRFPYLHNGSVPNLLALLTPASERPRVFSLKRAGEFERFDPTALGLTLPQNNMELQELERRAAAGAQDVYDVARDEHSNEGHEKGLDLSLEEKFELIEYLKTL